MKKNFSKRTSFIQTAILLSLAVILSFTISALSLEQVFAGGTPRKVPIYSVERNDNLISISFDCAYGTEYTDSLLETLDNYGVKCTFFATQFWVEKYPETLKKIADSGHEIGTHSKTHPNMSKLTKTQIEDELTSSKTAIEKVINKPVTLFRAPFGDYDNDVLEVAEKLSLYTIQWDVDSIDWKDITCEKIVNRVVSKTKSGSIILCHNNGKYTSKALPYILSNLQNKGYKFVPIGELIYKENYEINSFGKQIQTIK